MIPEFPGKIHRLLFTPARYKVAHGGRGGAKSWGFARMLLMMGAAKKLRVLCARELQISIKDSVHKLLKEQIEVLGLGAHYEVLTSEIRGRNGTQFVFSGMRSNSTKIKSMEGVDIAWVEEAETVSEESWNVLIPTIRKTGSEIWVSFNPREDHDPTYQRFVVNPPPGARVVQVGWQDNPWFHKSPLVAEKDYLYRIDPEAADHVWGGKTRRISEAQILRGRHFIEPFEPDPTWSGPHYGVDWGYAVDPTVFTRSWVREFPQDEEMVKANLVRRWLYVEHEAYGVGVEIDHTPQLFDQVPEGRKHISRADNARPETISHLQRHGYPAMVAVEKWPGSVEDGIEHLRTYEKIIIHPRCVHTAEEARLWSWKVDKITGAVLPIPVDKHNHCWDSIRYALQMVIQARTISYEYQAVPKIAEKKKSVMQPPDRSAPPSGLGGRFKNRPGGLW